MQTARYTQFCLLTIGGALPLGATPCLGSHGLEGWAVLVVLIVQAILIVHTLC